MKKLFTTALVLLLAIPVRLAYGQTEPTLDVFDELALGLCHSAARNIIGTLIRGRPVHRPLYFTGGVAANAGMVRALRELNANRVAVGAGP